jgi:hypothetical protein
MNIVILMASVDKISDMRQALNGVGLLAPGLTRTGLRSVTLGWVYVFSTRFSRDDVTRLMVDLPVWAMGPWDYYTIPDIV